MNHVAIMNKRLGSIEKILSGEKLIESRWLKNRSAPWLRVAIGDEIYFKYSGGPVTAKAIVDRIEYVDKLDNEKSRNIIERYEKMICLDDYPKGKNYCVLIWLTRPEKVTPFKIDKTGYGTPAAWMSIEDIKLIYIL